MSYLVVVITYLALLIGVEAEGRKDAPNHLAFLGGFDSPLTALDGGSSSSFLALVYPSGVVDELASTIPSMDLPERLRRPQAKG